MEYNDSFIWNNRFSNDYDIVVTSLPPIVKPPQRFETITIEGKDGDITNILGYSSYVKKIGIAFKHEEQYGICHEKLDTISNWLNGSGKIIFSNESDRYYEGIILNQIDYEKAIRFRTASIDIKVQPYKYDIRENRLVKTESFIVYNMSKVDQLPVITIVGSGQIHLLLNDNEICQINIEDRITLDSEKQEAYKDNVNTLMNRNMYGDFIKIPYGKSKISWYGTGTVQQMELSYRRRWL